MKHQKRSWCSNRLTCMFSSTDLLEESGLSTKMVFSFGFTAIFKTNGIFSKITFFLNFNLNICYLFHIKQLDRSSNFLNIQYKRPFLLSIVSSLKKMNAFLAHLTEGRVNYCHHLASVVVVRRCR